MADLSLLFKNGKTSTLRIKPGETKDAYTGYKSKLAKLQMKIKN